MFWTAKDRSERCSVPREIGTHFKNLISFWVMRMINIYLYFQSFTNSLMVTKLEGMCEEKRLGC
jgi:hypothetical protein